MIKNKHPVCWRTNVQMTRGWGSCVEELCWLGWIVKSFHYLDSRYQVVFHEFHERPVFGEWQVKNPTGCGCLPLLSHVITCVCTWWEWWKKQSPSEEDNGTVVELLNEWLLLFALTVLGEVAGEEGEPPSSVLMALCSCCRRCLCCIALSACCCVGLGTAPLTPAWPLVQAEKSWGISYVARTVVQRKTNMLRANDKMFSWHSYIFSRNDWE